MKENLSDKIDAIICDLIVIKSRVNVTRAVGAPPTIQEVIKRGGGVTAFAKLHGINYSTVRSWYYSQSNVNDWLVNLLDKATM